MIKVFYHKKFLKDLSIIPTNQRIEIEQFVFEKLPVCSTLSEANKFEKMTGYGGFYKARFGDYRIGAYCFDNRIELRRILQSKEIYRFFP